jgi:hypothetical protein
MKKNKVHKEDDRVTRAIGGALLLFILIGFISDLRAGPTDDNHVHVEQVADGDDIELNITQVGFANSIEFSFAHSGNVFNLQQHGNGNSISWVSYWGSGKSWGGDVDGSNNTENIIQYNGATYGRHIWGDENTVDVYQNGSHTHNLDIHADDVEHDLWQDGSGTHYSHVYYYGNTDGSITNLKQEGTANHNAQITLTGAYMTTLNVLQQGSTNQSYNLTQNCQTVGGCTVNVTQN